MAWGRTAELDRPATFQWASLQGFTAALLVIALALVMTVDELNDQVDERLVAQIIVTELESDMAEVQVAQAALMAGDDPVAADVEIADQFEDLTETTGELADVDDDDLAIAPLYTALDELGSALDRQSAAAEDGARGEIERLDREAVVPAFDGLDEVLEAASDDYEAASIRWKRFYQLGLLAALLLAWAAIGGLAWRYSRARRDARRSLDESRERFQTLAEAAFEGVAVVLHGTVVEASDAFATVLGYPTGGADGLSVIDLVTPESGEVMRTSVLDPHHQTFEATGLRADGSEVRLEVRTRPGSYRGEDVSILAVRDITERKALEQRLQHQAMHDTLTGLANRALFADRLEHALLRTSRSRSSTVAVLFFDLDDFKVVNDSLGHAAGDQLLVAVAERLRAGLRPEDTIARLGGDEFAVLIEDVTDDDAVTAAAQRLVDALKTEPVALPDGQAVAMASVGIAFADPGVDTPSDVLQRADLAMYEAKAQGKGRHVVFRPGMEARSRDRLVLVNELRHAAERGELEVHYQPQVDVTDARIRGFEALVRWDHPERGRISPDQFIPIAEQSGLIVPIGRWVLQRACEQLAAWRRTHDTARNMPISVNVSVCQLNDEGLIDSFLETVREAGLRPEDVVLEITESVLLNDNAGVRATLADLRRHGFRLAIDDFGTGYSSLSYLQRFSSDYIKIDKSFVDGLGRSREADNIIQTIISLAGTLEMTCVAEGVENGAQRDHLRELGCSYAQGFFFHRPLTATGVQGLLAQSAERDPAASGEPTPV